MLKLCLDALQTDQGELLLSPRTEGLHFSVFHLDQTRSCSNRLAFPNEHSRNSTGNDRSNDLTTDRFKYKSRGNGFVPDWNEQKKEKATGSNNNMGPVEPGMNAVFFI